MSAGLHPANSLNHLNRDSGIPLDSIGSAHALDDFDLILLTRSIQNSAAGRLLNARWKKVGRVLEMIGDRPIRLEIDGGANPETTAKVARTGADIIVASSAVFRGGCFEAYRRQYRRNQAVASLEASLQGRIEWRTAHSAAIERARISFPDAPNGI